MVSSKQKEKILEETKMLVEMFQNTNASDIELSKMCGISSSTVGRRLTNKSKILEAFPDNGEELFEIIQKKRQSNLERGKLLGGQISMIKNVKYNNLSLNLPKLSLEVFSKSENKQLMILTHIILTYRVKLPLLSKLFRMDEQEILEKIMSVCNDSTHRAIQFLFYYDNFNQDIAKNNLLNFYIQFIEAKQKKDKQIMNMLINEIDDSNIKSLLNQNKKLEQMTCEDILLLMNYQLKYCLKIGELANMFKINSVEYFEKVKCAIKNDKFLKERYKVALKFIKKEK